MIIDHLAIWTINLENMKEFYVNYFDGVSNEKYVNEKKGFSSYFISFKNGCRLELMNSNSLKTGSENALPVTGYSHMAFSLGSKEKVDELTDKLRNNGLTIISEPRTTGDGYYESSFLDPDGNLVEITE